MKRRIITNLTVRGPHGQNKDPYWQRVSSLSPVENEGVHIYSTTFTPDSAGEWRISYMRVSPDFKIWEDRTPPNEDISVKRSTIIPVKEAVTITEGPKVSPEKLYARKPAEVTLKLKTTSSVPVDLGF